MSDTASLRDTVFRRLRTNPLAVKAMLWARLPLAGFAGLRIVHQDETGAQVALPAGWRTQNPFRSTYFAAQAMAAELSTGSPALAFIDEAGVGISSLVTNIAGAFSKKATQEIVFTFKDGAAMKAAIAETVRTGEPVVFKAQTVGVQTDGTEVSRFEISWSFKRRRAG